jgi:hypothetical protein
MRWREKVELVAGASSADSSTVDESPLASAPVEKSVNVAAPFNFDLVCRLSSIADASSDIHKKVRLVSFSGVNGGICLHARSNIKVYGEKSSSALALLDDTLSRHHQLLINYESTS